MRLNLCFFLFILIFFGCVDSNEVIESQELKSNLIQTYIDNSELEKANEEEIRNNLEKAYGIASTLENNLLKIEKIHEIGIAYYSLKDFENYKKMNEKALEISKLVNDSLSIAKSYFHLGIHYRKSEIEMAYSNFYEAEKIYTTISTKGRNVKKIAFDRGTVLIDLAQILRKAKDYGQSESLTIRAIESFEESENKVYLPICYTNLGILAKFSERYEEAIEYHKKAIEFSKGTEMEVLQTLVSLNNIGTAYKSQKRYIDAKNSYNKALAYKDFLSENLRRHALLLDNLAYVNFLSKDLDSIPDLFFRSLGIREKINDQSGIATNTLHLAEYYQSINEDSIARAYAERSRDISMNLQNNEELLKAYQILSEVSDSYTGLGYSKKYIALNDSLVKEERLFRDKFARIRFETEEIVEENIQMSKENQILIIAILGLTALFLLGYIIFRQQQSNKELLFAKSQQESNEETYRLMLSQQIKLEEGRQLEQKRMSEELHDGVLGRLFGVRLSLDGINQRVTDEFNDARSKYIDELKSIEKEIRLISHDLGTEAIPTDVAYTDAVESLISDLCDAHKINFEFSNDENIDWEEVDHQKKVNFFRIIQESMQNIFKHAKAESIKISFDYVEDSIKLTILDDGIGFKANKVKKGIGLKNIASRVKQMSGAVEFLSDDSSGTTVSVVVPLNTATVSV
ncbi:tetratricopeptide repeat-containing sensor histidine kinase [Aquimarina pacifica]|uniref:tetratricopeptide repeat-containing sensor histidine kinase n=1 Tax=Aquimarina pacifica TaxID=1296415 RepID=UPI0004716DE3|nr:tetratricopeptide repeat-containing sensor histidine kinase [Aquimarina pacifica]